MAIQCPVRPTPKPPLARGSVSPLLEQVSWVCKHLPMDSVQHAWGNGGVEQITHAANQNSPWESPLRGLIHLVPAFAHSIAVGIRSFLLVSVRGGDTGQAKGSRKSRPAPRTTLSIQLLNIA